MDDSDKIIGSALIIAIILLCVYASILMVNAEYETTYYTRTITMKWIDHEILDTDYYFEFDNETCFKLDLHFDNPVYIYHKYEIGDTFEYNITRQVN